MISSSNSSSVLVITKFVDDDKPIFPHTDGTQRTEYLQQVTSYKEPSTKSQAQARISQSIADSLHLQIQFVESSSLCQCKLTGTN